MADYNFGRLPILVAEDNAFMGKLLRSVLRSLGVGNIALAQGGVEAVERLGCGRTVSPAEGPLAFDLVIADQTMPEIDGLMLLRWLRSHRASPNRFMPMIMLSGAARPQDVAAARDAGVSEFVAKPFSGASLAEHLLAVIERPRPFIYCAAYFGPDRRRNPAPVGQDLRRTLESEIRVIHGERAPPPLSNHGHAVWRFHLSNRLRDKVLTGDPSTAPALDPKLLEEAEQEIGRAGADYADWVKGAIDRLNRMLASCRGDPARALRHYHRMSPIALELASQGGMFGYPLVTDFGRLLYDYLRAPGQVDAQHVELVKAHVDAISAVIRQKIGGDGGEVGAALIDGLRRAKRRYEARAA